MEAGFVVLILWMLSCPASLYYNTKTTKTIEETASLFNVRSNLVNRTVDGFLVSINCSCLPDHDEYTWHMDYTVLNGDTWEKVSSKFGSFLVEKPDKSLIPSHVVTLDLVCGCSESNDLVTYKVEAGDTLFTICSRFKADVDMTGKLNGLDNPDLIHAGDVIFIPEQAGLQNLTLVEIEDKDPVVSTVKRSSKSRIHATVGILLAAFTITLFTVAFVFWRRSVKATVFSYNEVRDATSNFSTSLKIGQGSYGSVYLGKLRGKNAAIKQMKNTKSKEFLSELKILCKVHHSNLIELIGYAAGGDSLFLVYEYAQNGALSDHLHWPSVKGKKPLAWTTRVQIALDAAKGLEYIHQYTKPYYVHRDVKTSNILLDSNFRAKIADFGLVKLLEHSPEIAAAASRIVGTFGYLAPEYVRDGCVTTKSDVYAFGVVLMELITGQQALSRDANPGNNQYTEHRSLVEYMLAVFNDTEDFMAKLTECLDPNLTRYHKDSMLQMALLSKDCVDENWKRRPDMSNAAIRLSHILISSKEWEKMECCHNL
ncbi:hypothetical protein WN944_000269 [Citrus x changshan-huyou]|uniref:LysM domain receptor-like kinase 3 n=1 Tax=Citrus x changshan-huyou TaxID=2935761 RepID=A0AAP0ME86_9ROSI